MERFCSSVLRLAALQLIQQAGFDKTSSMSADVLTDVFGNYLELLGKTAKNHGMHAGRTKMNAFDVKATFETLGIKVEDLEDWLETERETKNYNKWGGPDPTPVIKDLLATGASKDPADELLLVFKERFSIIDTNKEELGIISKSTQEKIFSQDKLSLNRFNKNFLDESMKGGKDQEKEDDDDSIENFDDLFGEAPTTPPNGVIPGNNVDNTNNEGSKLPSNISEELMSKEVYDKVEDMNIDSGVNDKSENEKPDLRKEDKIKRQLEVRSGPSYIPNYLPPFPEGYPISHISEEKEGNTKTEETETLSDENHKNDDDIDEKQFSKKMENVDVDENMQPIISKNINEDNLTIANRKSNGSQARFTSDPLKLLAPENIENAFKSFTLHESLPSVSTGAVIESDLQKKKRKFEESFSSVPPGETIFSSSQNGFFEDLEEMRAPPELIPQELQLPMIKITRPPTATSGASRPEIATEEMMIDIVGDGNEGESFSSEDASSKPLTISLKNTIDTTNLTNLHLASTSVSSQSTSYIASTSRSKSRQAANLLPSTNKQSKRFKPTDFSNSPSIFPPQTLPTPQQSQIHSPPQLPSRKKSTKPKKEKTSKTKHEKPSAPLINSETTPLASTGKIKIRLPMKKSASTIPVTSTSTLPPVQFQLPPPPLVTTATTQEEVINCICEYPNIDNNKFMIACDTCSTWFHGGCVGFGDEMQVVVDAWHFHRLVMANRTVSDAIAVHGTNPQYLIEKIIRSRIYDSLYWKESCFGLTAETLIDRAIELTSYGGQYGNQKPTEFLCLTLKLLQLQPSKDIIIEFIRTEEYKYLRALGAFYLRLVGTSLEIYQYLEPLLNDYRKLRRRNPGGDFEIVCMDEFIDELLREERVCDTILPRISKRYVLEENDELPRRIKTGC
ncbi:13614_t:CDS:2 [Ambispora leptoticha]|uniref:13614_t:CDS:1 n=1 Tax=Ambispora leptoticha TaxID=144679 RepID=A0A9N8ZV80_9GLOM|nr:13614_t:CDS:2 [Ambispora leptoticha]